MPTSQRNNLRGMRKLLNSAIYSINAAALLIGAAGLLSRILGVVRDRLLASHFGASRQLDIYYAAFQIPDFMYTILLLGASSAAIIPVFARLKKDNQEKAVQLISSLFVVFLSGAVVMSLVVFITIPFLLKFIVPGFSMEEQRQTIILSRIMLASPILLGLSGIISAVLQSARNFLPFALSSVFYNIGIIAGIIFLLPQFGLSGLAVGVVFGALLHLLVQVPSFAHFYTQVSKDTASNEATNGKKEFSKEKKVKIRYPILSDSISDSIKTIARLAFPRVIAIALNRFTIIILVAIASTLSAGSVAIFRLSENLHYLPIGVFGISFAVAAFPSLNEQYIASAGAKFLDILYRTLSSILFWVLPLSVFFIVLRAQIVRIALGGGKFDWAETRLAAASLGILAVAILAESIRPLLIRAFYALEDTKTPLFVNAFSSLVTILSAFGSVYFLKSIRASIRFAEILRLEGLKDISVVGIAAALSIGSSFNIFLLSILLKRKVFSKLYQEKSPSFFWNNMFSLSIAALVGGISAFLMLRIIDFYITINTFWTVFLQGVGAFLVGTLVYAVALYLFGNDEIMRIYNIFKRSMLKLYFLPRSIENGESMEHK